MLKIVVGCAIALLGTGACASHDSTRQAAPADTPPACTSGLSTYCTVSSTDTETSIAVQNGVRILFEEAGSTLVGGESWPTYSIAANETSDSAGEAFFPLPARVTFIVGDSSSTVEVEVACCDSPTGTQT